jgi:hypothetical protein
MKQEIKKVLDELEAELEPFDELEAEEPEEPEYYHRTAEEEHEWHEAMKRLVIAGFAGDEEAWSIWSDMWKDEHGCRPRYTDAEIRWMYGLDERRA